MRSWPLGSPEKPKGAIWVRFEVEVERRSRFVARSLWVAGKVEARGSPAMGSLFFLSLSLSFSLSLVVRGHDFTHTHTLSLSLSVFRKMVFEGKIKTEIILRHKHVRTEKHFRKMYFPCATKYPHLQKSIFGNHFHPIQTQPNFYLDCTARNYIKNRFVDSPSSAVGFGIYT